MTITEAAREAAKPAAASAGRMAVDRGAARCKHISVRAGCHGSGNQTTKRESRV